MSAKKMVKFHKVPADAQFREGFRLRHSSVWMLQSGMPCMTDMWLNARWFEQLCLDKELEELAKSASDLDREALRKIEARIQLLFKQYLRTVMEKFMALRPQLAVYFAAKAECGSTAKDLPLYSECELPDVERFIEE